MTSGGSFRIGEGAGVDVVGGKGSQGQMVVGTSGGYTVLGGNYTPPFFPGVEFHGGVTKTWVASVNVPELWRRLWNSGPPGNRVVKAG